MNPEVLALSDRYDRLARKLEDETIARLETAIDRSYRNLERELLRQYPKIQSEGSLLATQRRAVLMNDLASLLQIFRPDQAAEYERLFQGVIVAAGAIGGDLSGALMQAIAPGSLVRAFAGINLEAAALEARDATRRLYRYNDEFIGKASAIVEQGLIQGWGARRVADVMRSEMGVAKFNAERIARTEVMSALNDGAQLRYQDAGIEFVQWMATPSEGLCPVCAVRNMQVYPAGKVRVPNHPFCRCVLLPYSREWERLGLTDDEFAGEYRDRLLQELERSGKQPNTGVSPFERAAGLTQPPEPVWKPGTERALASRTTGTTAASSDGMTARPGIHSRYIDRGREVVGDRLTPKATGELARLKAELARVEAEFDKAFDLDPAGVWDSPIGKRFAEASNKVKAIEGSDPALAGMRELRAELLRQMPRAEAEALAANVRVLKSASRQIPEAELRSMLADFYQVTGGRGSSSLKRIALDESRAYASKDDGRLNIGRNGSREEDRITFWHEMGHHVEFENEETRAALEAWVKARATSQKRQSMNQITGQSHWGASELAYPDQFIDPYVGRVYDNGSTEVLSMGLQFFDTPERMLELYRKDPEHFHLILGILRGA